MSEPQTPPIFVSKWPPGLLESSVTLEMSWIDPRSGVCFTGEAVGIDPRISSLLPRLTSWVTCLTMLEGSSLCLCDTRWWGRGGAYLRPSSGSLEGLNELFWVQHIVGPAHQWEVSLISYPPVERVTQPEETLHCHAPGLQRDSRIYMYIFAFF